MRIVLFAILIVLIAAPDLVMAQDKDAFRSTDHPLPRFASLGKNKSYVRTGPGARYPIKWIFQKKHLPVEIILEFDHWRKIIDSEGEVGWIHVSQLSGRRGGLIRAQDLVSLHRAPAKSEAIIAYLEPNVVTSISSCNTNWCLVNVDGYKGWVEKQYLWGVYKNEIIRN